MECDHLPLRGNGGEMYYAIGSAQAIYMISKAMVNPRVIFYSA